MKDKIIFLIIGILIGAIIATGVFMIINKNQVNVRPGGMRSFQGGEGGPVNLDGATIIEGEDGSVKYEFPDGRVIQRGNQNGGGQPTGGSVTIINGE